MLPIESGLEVESLNAFFKSGDCTPLAGLADWLLEHTDRHHFARLCSGVAAAATDLQKHIHWFYTNAGYYENWAASNTTETLAQWRLRNAACDAFSEKWGDEQKDVIQFIWDHDPDYPAITEPDDEPRPGIDHYEPLWMCHMERRPVGVVAEKPHYGAWANFEAIDMIDLGEDVVTNRYPADPYLAITDGAGQLIPKIRCVHAELLTRIASPLAVPQWAWKETVLNYPPPNTHEYAVIRMGSRGPVALFPEVPGLISNNCVMARLRDDMTLYVYAGDYTSSIKRTNPLDWSKATALIAKLEEAGWDFDCRTRARAGHNEQRLWRHQDRKNARK